MLGIAIGVLALITVLSVMNGFQKELTGRILAMASHATVVRDSGAIDDWQAVAARLYQQPGIVGVAPYFRAEGMLVHEHRVHGVVLRGILPEQEKTVSLIAEKMESGEFSGLQPGQFGIGQAMFAPAQAPVSAGWPCRLFPAIMRSWTGPAGTPLFSAH